MGQCQCERAVQPGPPRSKVVFGRRKSVRGFQKASCVYSISLFTLYVECLLDTLINGIEYPPQIRVYTDFCARLPLPTPTQLLTVIVK